MISRGLFLAIVSCVASATVPAASALGIRILHQDPDATARGEAFTATADKPSAIYYNPAGLTQLEGDNLQVGAYSIAINVDHRAPGTGKFSDTPDRFQTIAQVFYARTLATARATVGFGVYSPYGLGTQWADESPFRSYATKSKLVYLCLNPVAAFKLTDTLSVAGGFTANYGHADLRRGILVPGDEFRFDGDGWSYGFTAGILWQPANEHSFGIMYRSRSIMDFDGTARVHSKTPFLFPSSRELASLDFDFPQHIMAGYSYRPAPGWNLEADVDWTDWEDVGTLHIRKGSGDLFQVFDWRSRFTYKVGATRSFNNGLSLSAGYFYGENATPDRNFNPSVPNLTLHVFSIGGSYRTDNWDVGLTYNLGYGPKRTVTGSTPTLAGESADGDYTFIGHGFSLAASRKF